MGRSSGCAVGAGDPVQRLIAWAVGVFVVLLAFGMVSPLGANEHIPRDQPIPQNIRWVNATATGANTSASAMWSDATGRTTHHKFPVHVNASTLGRLANAAVRRGLPLAGWGLLLRDLVNGAGWVIDELQRQVINPGTPQQALGDVAFCIGYGGSNHCASTGGKLAHLAHNVGQPALYSQPCEVSGYFGDGRASYRCRRTDNPSNWHNVTNEGRVTRPVVGWGSNVVNQNSYTEPHQIADADLGNMVKASRPVIDAILIDPQTGAPIRTQELTDALNNLRRSLEAANGLPAGVDLAPANDYAESTPSQTDLPEFCTWADVVCDFIDWFKGEDGDIKDLPEHELVIDPDSWSSGVGGGSCPAPISESWDFMGTQARFEFDYQPVCSFATMMRPFLIVCALICAAFIMAGLRSAGGKT